MENSPKLSADTKLLEMLDKTASYEVIIRYTGSYSDLLSEINFDINNLSAGFAIAYTDRSGLDLLINNPQIIQIYIPELYYTGGTDGIYFNS